MCSLGVEVRSPAVRPCGASPDRCLEAVEAFGHGDLLLRDLLAQLAMLLDSLALAEVLKLEHLADLDLALPLVRVGAAFDQLDRLLLGLDLRGSSSRRPA